MPHGENGKELSYLIKSHTICSTFLWQVEFEQTHKLAFDCSLPEELSGCFDDNVVRHCDRSQGTRLDTASPPILRYTYCSLFLAHVHKNHRGLVTHPRWNLPPCCSTFWVITCFYYIVHTVPIKHESSYEMGTKSWTFQPLLSCLLVQEEASADVHTQS